MALQFLLESLDGLDDGVKALYQEKDGKYQLSIDGLPKTDDLDGLKAKVEQLLGEKKTAATKAKEAEEAARKSGEEAARKSGDIEALDKSWTAKFEAMEKEKDGTISGLNDSINGLTVDRDAIAMAAEMAVDGSADVLLPHIRSRLAVEVRDGRHVTVVRDAEGKASALTMDDLKTEISNNKAFSPLIVASRGSGGGAGQGGQGSGGGNQSDFFDKKSKHYSLTEQTKIFREDPSLHQQLQESAA